MTGPEPEAAARYRAELYHAAVGTLRPALLFAGLGVLAAILRGTVLPAVPRLVPVTLIVVSLGLLAIGTVRRWRYHHRRTRSRD